MYTILYNFDNMFLATRDEDGRPDLNHKAFVKYALAADDNASI